MDHLFWNIYEVTSKEPIHNVKFRGRVRKYALEKNITLLCENATDKENTVRFALLEDQSLQDIKRYITSIVDSTNIHLAASKVENPVLSKLKVNDSNRYTC